VAPFALEVPIKEAFHLLEPVGRELHPDVPLFVEWITNQAKSDR
jgi:LysR family glycine cleavage system transcriptional activator